MVQVQLKGMLAPDFSKARAPLMQFDLPPAPEYKHPNPAVEVHDARQLQSSATSDAAFFEDHGFVLLQHKTAVKDWDHDIGSVYQSEIAAIVRERLLPGRELIIQQATRVVRRGYRRRYYVEGVHSDGPLTPEIYASNLRAIVSAEFGQAWLETLASDKVAGFMLIDFWRTTNMNEPLRHMPLALCDPASLDRSDLIPGPIANVAPQGRLTEILALRFNPRQRWYYYPEMTTEEVIAFKICEYSKDDSKGAPQTVFHSAFCDPATPDDCERRQSCEHRAGVMILRDRAREDD
jgi:hypothetical protein